MWSNSWSGGAEEGLFHYLKVLYFSGVNGGKVRYLALRLRIVKS